MARYAITIFLSAFLLFQVQPMIGKFILPWFGGVPSVWTACMLFFQIMLLAGYGYAHLISSKLFGRLRMFLHLGLLGASLCFLPIRPDFVWKAAPAEDAPTLRILGLLGVTIGLPYFLLASTGPLLQESFRRETGHTPYRLYALSNVGSLLALLSYPFVFEPQMTLHSQIIGWSAGYVVFIVLCAWCVVRYARSAPVEELAKVNDQRPAIEEKPRWDDVLLWLALAACGSSLLLATTNQLCQEVSTVPFLWVLPLAIYLVTFIICFDHERWYHRTAFVVLLIGAVLAAVYALASSNALNMGWQLAIYSGVLWIACMVCHGELVRARPAPHDATLFYLMISAGGALGGVLVGLVAPLVFNDFWEYQTSLFASVVLAFVALFRLPRPTVTQGDRCHPRRKPPLADDAGRLRPSVAGLACTSIAIGLGWLLLTSQTNSPQSLGRNLVKTRDFYGVARVNMIEDRGNPSGSRRVLYDGWTIHGAQFVDPGRRRMPITYYGPTSGIAAAIACHPRSSFDKPAGSGIRIGVVGLGCGTIAAYGRPGDTIHFYEINPELVRISRQYFTYCADSQASEVDVVLGNARIRMEQEIAAGHPQQFDVLAVDAFSGDAIPMHLLTRECAELYRQHLKSDGLLCLHITNRALDLSGVVRGLADVLGYKCVRIANAFDARNELANATWVILTVNQEFLDNPAIRQNSAPWADDDPPPIVWTDDHASLWQVIRKLRRS